MNIYYSHSVKEYNTETEKKQIEHINKYYPNSKIVNPKDILVNKEDLKLLKGKQKDYLSMMEKYYFKEIDNCDLLIAFSLSTDGIKKEISYAKKVNKMVKIMVGEEWQKDRNEFYNKSKAYKFIENYFDVEKGTRCIAGHKKIYYIEGKQYTKNSKGDLIKFNPDYYTYNGDFKKMITLEKEKLIEFNCIHTFMRTFNEKPINYYSRFEPDTPKESVIGINPVLELDTPYETLSEGSPRKDFFNSINEFNEAIKKMDKELNNINTDYNIMFSGNGIYFLLEGYYGNELNKYEENLINLIDQLKETELGNPLKVHLDNKESPWNDYFKIPFTFHEKKSRISCPLPKGELNKEWIKEHTDIVKIKEDYSLISELINESGWNKIW